MDKEEEIGDYKKLSNEWSSIVNDLVNSGHNGFGITINNNTFFGNMRPGCYNELCKRIIKFIKKYYFTTTLVLIVPENNKRGVLHLHIFICMRNFIDYNRNLKNNISIHLTQWLNMCYSSINSTGDFDIRVDSLRYFRDMKNWIMYLHKNYKNMPYPGKIFSSFYWFVKAMSNLGDIYEYYLKPNYNMEWENNLWEEEAIMQGIKMFHGYLPPFLKIKDFHVDINRINGVILTDNVINQGVLMDLIRYYIILNDLYIYNDNIYKKLNNYKISYEIVGPIKEILYDNFAVNVVGYFMINFKLYFVGFNFDKIIKDFLETKQKSIDNIYVLLTNRINPDFSLLEFTDGIYSIKYDRFISNRENYLFNKTVSTIKYYNISYNWVRKSKPERWIKTILESLNIKCVDYENNWDFKMICLYLCNIFHRNIFDKRQTLHIWGESNTGKTTLITDVLNNYFGLENVGSIIGSGSKNFKWQELEGKILAILDEFKYLSSSSGEFLKLLSGENLLVEKKYSKNHINIKNIPIIIIGNNKIRDLDNNINEALSNRIFSIEFVNKLKNTKGLKDKIKKEEVNIIIYINKTLFKLKEMSEENNFHELLHLNDNNINKYEYKAKKVSTGKTNKNIIELIERGNK